MVFPRLEASLWFGAVDFKEDFVAVYDTYVLVKVALFAFQTLVNLISLRCVVSWSPQDREVSKS